MPISKAEYDADMQIAAATSRAMVHGKLADEMEITRTALLCRASEAVHDDHKQFFRDRADHLESLISDLRAGWEVDLDYHRMIHDEFAALT